MWARGSTGQMVEHPALQVERNAHTLLLRFAAEYGITPSARARIAGARVPPPDGDDLEDMPPLRVIAGEGEG